MTTGAINCGKLQSDRHHQQTNTQCFTGRMPFLSPGQGVRALKGKVVITVCLWCKGKTAAGTLIVSRSFTARASTRCHGTVNHISVMTWPDLLPWPIYIRHFSWRQAELAWFACPTPWSCSVHTVSLKPSQLGTKSIVQKNLNSSEIRQHTYAMNASWVSLSNDRYTAAQRDTTTTTTTTNVLIIVTLHTVAGALYISDFKKRWQ